MEPAAALPGCAAAAPSAPAIVSQQVSISANGVTLRADAMRQVPAFLDALP